VRVATDGRYACVMEPGKILFETPEPEGREITTLRRVLEVNAPLIFTLPASMAADDGGPDADPFEGWDHDELCLIFINGKAAVVIACPDAESARETSTRPLHILVDRLLRLEVRYRFDAKGRGFFFSQPKLDFVTIGRADA
jgi:hypothetical protein